MTFTPNSAGGEYSHVLTENELASHYHKVGVSWNSGKGTNSPINGLFQHLLYNPDNGYGTNSKYTGGNQAHNNIQPYLSVYYWRRTA